MSGDDSPGRPLTAPSFAPRFSALRRSHCVYGSVIHVAEVKSRQGTAGANTVEKCLYEPNFELIIPHYVAFVGLPAHTPWGVIGEKGCLG